MKSMIYSKKSQIVYFIVAVVIYSILIIIDVAPDIGLIGNLAAAIGMGVFAFPLVDQIIMRAKEIRERRDGIDMGKTL